MVSHRPDRTGTRPRHHARYQNHSRVQALSEKKFFTAFRRVLSCETWNERKRRTVPRTEASSHAATPHAPLGARCPLGAPVTARAARGEHRTAHGPLGSRWTAHGPLGARWTAHGPLGARWTAHGALDARWTV